MFFGTVTNPKNEKLHDLTPREVLTFAPLLVLAFWIGLYPKPFFEILEQPVNQLVLSVRPDYPGLQNTNAPREAVARPPVPTENMQAATTTGSTAQEAK